VVRCRGPSNPFEEAYFGKFIRRRRFWKRSSYASEMVLPAPTSEAVLLLALWDVVAKANGELVHRLLGVAVH